MKVFDELGRRLGLGSLVFSPPEPLVIDIGGVGQLSFDLSAETDDILLCLARPLAAYDHRTLLKALEWCAAPESASRQLHCGYLKDNLLLMARLPAAALSAPALEQAMDFLLKTNQKL